LNTCHRFEFYGWPVAESDSKEDCIVARVQKNLFNGHTPEDLLVNVLCGADAWQHLVRSVSGLNSGIPGDRDIVDQLFQAQSLAERAGTAGPMTRQLVAEAVELERKLRKDTGWGRFDPSYCYAALAQIVELSGLELADCRCLAIGGSSTSRSVLSSLIERFHVPSRQLALAYRGHGGGQIKLLRKAIRDGRRIRVQTYNEPQVIRAIADADVVVYGIDHDRPVLRASQIRDQRDFAARPLTVIDFNTFGSTEGLDGIEGVTLWTARQVDEAVVAFAAAMCATPEFGKAVEAAEEWIVERAPSWHSPCAKPHRCPRLFGEALDGEMQEPVPVEARWRTCVRCAEEMPEPDAAALESEAS
jgi:glutamyl-tRNA reductase